jgi:hypothetical protein
MKKVLLIGGGLAVVGGLAYLYLKNKKKQEAILGGASATQPSSIAPNGTTPAGTTSSANDGGITPLPKGSTITPTTVDGVTTSVITTPSNTAPTIQNQMELDAIMDSIKKNMELSRKRQISISMWKPSNAFRSSGGLIGVKPTNPYPAKIEKLKNDLLKLGYEYKEGSGGSFLVKI